MYPARTPTGTELAPMLERRLDEVGPDGLLFPSPRGHWPRRSTYRRNTFNPAATAAGWPPDPGGALGVELPLASPRVRHLGAAQPRARIEDVSRLLGHSTGRVTQDLYVSPDGDLFDRFQIGAGTGIAGTT